MSIFCKLFGHHWTCYMGIQSYCKWCGVDYTEYYNSLSKDEKKKIDDEIYTIKLSRRLMLK